MAKLKRGQRVVVREGSGTRSGTVATVVPPFDWKKEEGAYKPVPKGYVYLKSEEGYLFTMPPNRLNPIESMKSEHLSVPVERKIIKAAIAKFGKADWRPVFEHGHWWLPVYSEEEERDIIFDVVDAEPGIANTGFDFESTG